MERLSALMDDELDQHAIDGELDQIKGDPQREEAWATYHMIGDALRGQIDPVRGIEERVRAMLANEPTVLAPRSWKIGRAAQRVALPLAASVCGVAVVAWLALSSNSVISPAGNLATQDVVETPTHLVQQTNVAGVDEAGLNEGGLNEISPDASGTGEIETASSATDDMNEYLMAHQQFSPSTAMQGVVPYVRTVSSGDNAR
jgi:sigma-E factor negative regulatory protein RseA